MVFSLYIILGLLKTENDEAKKMALTIARRYTVGAMFSCPDGSEVCNMFEKVSYSSSYFNCSLKTSINFLS